MQQCVDAGTTTLLLLSIAPRDTGNPTRDIRYKSGTYLVNLAKECV